MRVLLLNGAPGSGKDTIASMIKTKFHDRVYLEKFARPLKDAVPVAYGVNKQDWNKEYDAPSTKNNPHPRLYGKSAREAQIALSETYFKPLHGQDIFGRMLLDRIKRLLESDLLYEYVVVSDSGFKPEAEVLVDQLGKNNVDLWRVQRAGYGFKNDSRSHICLRDRGIYETNIYNNGDLTKLRHFVMEKFTNFMQEGKSWRS